MRSTLINILSKSLNMNIIISAIVHHEESPNQYQASLSLSEGLCFLSSCVTLNFPPPALSHSVT